MAKKTTTTVTANVLWIRSLHWAMLRLYELYLRDFQELEYQLKNSPKLGLKCYVKEQLGHSSIRMTVDVYGHLVPGANRQAVNRLPTEKDAPTKSEVTIQEKSKIRTPDAPKAKARQRGFFMFLYFIDCKGLMVELMGIEPTTS